MAPSSILRRSVRPLVLGLGLGAAALSLAACEDPAANKPKATVTDSKPAATAAATSAATGATPAGATAATTSLSISPETSKIGWTGSKVTGKHEGSFAKFTGKVDFSPGKVETSKISLEIDMDSVTTDQDKLVGHLKSPDFFDVAKFPKATFVSKEIKAGGTAGATHTISGDLTLHGVTKTISFPANVTIAGDTFKATSEFSINRKDFGLNYPGKADDLIRDDVVLKLSIDAKK
jgi:polyisoprenoid-binding protein YceI